MPGLIVSIFGIIYVILNAEALVSADKYRLADNRYRGLGLQKKRINNWKEKIRTKY